MTLHTVFLYIHVCFELYIKHHNDTAATVSCSYSANISNAKKETRAYRCVLNRLPVNDIKLELLGNNVICSPMCRSILYIRYPVYITCKRHKLWLVFTIPTLNRNGKSSVIPPFLLYSVPFRKMFRFSTSTTHRYWFFAKSFLPCVS